MRKALPFALLLCAAPLAAQEQSAAAAPPAPASAQPAEPAPGAQPATEAPKPTLEVTREEWRQTFREQDAREERAQAGVGSRGWWYLVAAIAVGVIIAAIVL